MDLIDIYSDYLIAQNKLATATGLADLLSGDLSHDQVTRFLNGDEYGSKNLWEKIKPDVRRHEVTDDGILMLDDMPAEKPYTDENDIVCWHYSHAKKRIIKGVDLLTCMVRYGDVSLPVGYEVIKKEIRYCDIKTKKEKRTSAVTKNEIFRNLLNQATNLQRIKYRHILADSWFSSKENIKFIHNDLNKLFIMGIKSNRKVAMTEEDKMQGCYQTLSSISLEDGVSKTVYLKDVTFPAQVLKKIFKNENGSEGTLYLVTNDLNLDGEQILGVYKKRWSIEEYHKSVKQNASFEKSPTKTVRSQLNHIFCSILAYCKLERLKIKTKLNHFALKYKLIVKANQTAMQEIQNINNQVATA